MTKDNRCSIFGRLERPEVCESLKPSAEMCGDTIEHANKYLSMLEGATKPDLAKG